ncbi:MAG: phosphoadenylyl-sulfate reductase [Cyanobacteriota bacterium]|nr:phosphoadenylyl-sulfate reductase [Cyanobacteriota bacterium]
MSRSPSPQAPPATAVDPSATAGYPTAANGLPIDLAAERARLDPMEPEARLAWALDTFGEGFCLTTSFGIQAAVLLHMVSQLGEVRGNNHVPVIWVDTGYLPEETYRYAEELRQRLPLNLKVVQAEMSPARMEALHGKLWETGRLEDLSLYNQLRKVEPLDRAMKHGGVRCWASGVRGGQTNHRRTMAPLDPVRGLWSLRPLLSWNTKDVYYYMERHQLPQHPLFAKGYSTVGDWHSSAADDGDRSGRATRFGGLKQECGIHLPGLMGEGI